MRKFIPAVLMMALIGCVHATQKPADWNGTALSGYGGIYSNTGKISQESERLGFNLRKLTGFFWPGSNLQADEVVIIDERERVIVHARSGKKLLATGKFELTNRTLILIRTGTKEGTAYKTTDSFQRTEQGLIIESRSDSAGVFIVPMAGSYTGWYFFPLK